MSDAGAQMLMLNPMFEQMEHLTAFHEALNFLVASGQLSEISLRLADH